MTLISGIDATALGALIEALYEAVDKPDAWSSVMALLCQCVGADSSCIRFYSSDWSQVLLSSTFNFDPTLDNGYRQYYSHIDPIIEAIRSTNMTPGTTALLPDLLPNNQLRRSEFYNDYMRPQDKCHVMGGYLHLGDSVKILFGAQRGRMGKAFKPEDNQILGLMEKHFHHVLRLHQIAAEHKQLVRSFGQVLDTLKVAAFFLDKQARVRFYNPGAEKLLHAGEFIRVNQGRLCALRHDKDSTLQALISEVISNDSMSKPAMGGTLQLQSSTAGSDEKTAIVLPWRGPSVSASLIGPQIVAAVFIGARTRPDLRRAYLVGAFGLTQTEARLVSCLVKTCNLSQAAAAIGVSQQTARDYLKSIFLKTDCHSQVELISAILNSPVGIWGRANGTTDNAHREPSSARQPPPGVRNLH